MGTGGGIDHGGGSLTLTNSTVSNNTVSGGTNERGGGVYHFGSSLTLTNSTVSGNTASGGTHADGGGIHHEFGSATLTNVTISGNTASSGTSGDGGGIYHNGSSLTLTDSTISGNTASGGADPRGGGVYHVGPITLTNVTVSGNTSHSGGGLYILAGATLTNVTFSGNKAFGGAFYARDRTTLRATVLDTGDTGQNCLQIPGELISLGSNISDDTSCGLTGAGDLQVANGGILLGPLQNNGGPTETHALLPDSPAIDRVQGSCTSDGTPGGTAINADQRGVTRPRDGDSNGSAVCDIGAFERRPGALQFSAPTYSVGEGGGSITITVQRVGGSDGAVGATVTLSGGASTATPGVDYTGTTFPISFADGNAVDQTFNIPIANDTLDEDDETVLLTLGTPTGRVAVGSPATLTIQDDDLPPTVSVGNVTLNEGTGGSPTAQFQVTLSAASGKAVTIQAQTANGAGASGAVAGSDYTAVTQSLTFNPTDTTKTVDVPIAGDTIDEVDETFTLSLSGPVNASLGTATGTATIVDDDTSLISIDDQNVVEGNGGSVNITFTVSLSLPNSRTVTVQAQAAAGTTNPATPGTEFTPVSQSITFSPGETSKSFAVPVFGDTTDEPNETFVVNLSSATNATIDDNQGVGTIVDDDGPPSLTVLDRNVVEGNSGTTNAVFTVMLLPASGQEVRVTAQTADGTGPNGAAAGADYTATNQALIFAPGDTSKTLTVPVIGEQLAEADETFLVNLSAASNATIQDGQAVGTIENDDVPSITVGDVRVAEGDSGSTNAVFTLSLSLTSTQTVTVVAQTVNGTATAGQDYQAVGPVLVTFNPGITSQTLSVTIIPDALNEANETFFVNVSTPTNAVLGDAQGIGTITNDDVSGGLAFGASVVTVQEQAGSVTLTVQRGPEAASQSGSSRTNAPTGNVSPSALSPVTVNYATANGSALDGQDYTATTGTLAFGVGETSKTIIVPILSDSTDEQPETFTITLSTPTGGATLGTPNTVTVTIADVDTTPCQTTLTTAIPAGTNVLPVLSQAGCNVGDVVAVDPGQPNEDRGQILGFGSIIVQQQTAHTHAAGAVVVRVSGLPAVPQNGSGGDDTDKPRRNGENVRRNQEHTNAAGKDDESVEGDVLETRCDQPWPSVIIANRDGAVEVRLLKEAQKACSSIQVGDYLEADGEKQHELLFDAHEVSVK